MQVKVILHRGPSEEVLPRKEIRRFALEKLDSFQHLKDQVVMLYDDLTGDTPLRFLWTDEEGDNVQFSSDTELKEAVNFFQNSSGPSGGKLFKLIVRFPQPPPPPPASAQNGQKRGNASENGLDPAKMEKKIQKIHERQCKKNMMTSIRAAAAAGQPLEALLNNFHAHFNRMMAPEDGLQNGETIPIQHADGTVTCNGATVTTTTTSNTSTNDEQPAAKCSSSTTVVETAHAQPAAAAGKTTSDEFEDVSDELKQQKMKEAEAKMNELGFVGEWVGELLKSVDGDVVRAVSAMNPEK